jgi:hypothetical protein
MTGMIELLIYIAIIGLIVWVLIQLVPMPSAVRTALVAVAILIILLVVLRTLGGVDVAARPPDHTRLAHADGIVASMPATRL